MNRPANHATPTTPQHWEAQEYSRSGIFQDSLVAGIGGAALYGLYELDGSILARGSLAVIPAALVAYGMAEAVGRIRNRPTSRQQG